MDKSLSLLRRRAVMPLLALPLVPTSLFAKGNPPGPLRVVASFSILADLVREIGGGAVECVSLVGPNGDAHVFEPRPLDAKRLADADLVVVNGLGFEGWLDRLVRSSGYRGPVAVASEGVPARRLGREPDPHAWQDLAHAQRYARNLRDAMARARPARAGEFERRCAEYVQRLAGLDREVRARFDAIPRQQRRAIISHDAFGYFGAAYGIEFLPAQGVSTDSEPSASTVARLIEQIRRHGVRAVFVENIADPRLLERIARDAGAVIGGRLYSDALSPPGTEADTYLKLFTHNAATIAAGLQGRKAA